MKACIRGMVLLLVFSSSLAYSQDKKPDLTGTWTLDKAKSELRITRADGLVWVVNQSKTGTITITERLQGEGKQSEYKIQCNMGKGCEVSGDSEPLKVTSFYNGPALVQMLTKGEKGDTIVKRLIVLTDEGKSLQVSVTQLVPEDKTEKLVFQKEQQAVPASQ